jgi:hypothetical protein
MKQLLYIAWHPESSWSAVGRVNPADYNQPSAEEVCEHLRQTWSMHLSHRKSGYGVYYIS